jgi:hypothetical protein
LYLNSGEAISSSCTSDGLSSRQRKSGIKIRVSGVHTEEERYG